MGMKVSLPPDAQIEYTSHLSIATKEDLMLAWFLFYMAFTDKSYVDRVLAEKGESNPPPIYLAQALRIGSKHNAETLRQLLLLQSRRH